MKQIGGKEDDMMQQGPDTPEVMRLRVELPGIKPAPWRRLEVTTATTLAGLHEVIQVAMGWEDLHLHCFRILGRRYDGEYADLTCVVLADLRLRAGERFTYTYNHFAGWEHELRVEAVGPAQPRCRYPRCVGGQHPCPPEWCSDPEALDEIKDDLLGLSYAEDLDLMLAFGRAVLDARWHGARCTGRGGGGQSAPGAGSPAPPGGVAGRLRPTPSEQGVGPARDTNR